MFQNYAKIKKICFFSRSDEVAGTIICFLIFYLLNNKKMLENVFVLH
jgi:hypothetical protein